MKYLDIRKLSYKTDRKALRSINIDMDDWLRFPYVYLKVRFYIEFSCIIVFFLQYTRVKPNWITILYALAGITGGILLSTGENNLIIVGVLIFSFKIILDAADGLLARVKKKSSSLGAMLDVWGGLVGEYSFLVGLGVYLFNATVQIHFLYLMLLIILIKTLDIRNYTYNYLMYSIYKNKNFIKNFKNRKKNILSSDKDVSNVLFFLKNFLQNFLEYRGRTVDLIGIIIVFELYFGQIILTNYIYYLFFIKLLMFFLGGFYLVYYKDFIKQVVSRIKK